MQIAHINLARGYRGGERQTELLIRGLAKLGVRQVLIARHKNPLLSRLDDVDVEIRACSSNLLAAFRATRGVDLVQAHEGRGVYAAWARHAFSGTPYVITRRISKTLGSGSVTRRAYTHAAFVVSVAKAVADKLSEYDRRIQKHVIHSSSSGLAVDESAVREIRERFPGKWLIGNVAALENRQKGQEYAIAVARRLQDNYPDLQFVFVGSGNDEDLLRQMSKGLSNVTFTGFVDNVGDYLAAFDLFILPSKTEGIGGILLDAMNQALPIISTRVGGVPEIVRDEENGLLIDAGSTEQLEDAILHLYTDPELRVRLGARGREFSRDFSADEMSRKYLELYERALASAPAPGTISAR